MIIFLGPALGLTNPCICQDSILTTKILTCRMHWTGFLTPDYDMNSFACQGLITVKITVFVGVLPFGSSYLRRIDSSVCFVYFKLQRYTKPWFIVNFQKQINIFFFLLCTFLGKQTILLFVWQVCNLNYSGKSKIFYLNFFIFRFPFSGVLPL